MECLVQSHRGLARRSDREKGLRSLHGDGASIAYSLQKGVMELSDAIVLAGEWSPAHEQVFCAV